MRRGVAFLLLTAAFLLPVAAALALPGDLDPSFGSGGLVTTDFSSTNDQAYALVQQFGGKLLAAGQTDDPVNAGTFDFGLVRYNADGTLDASFGPGAKVRTSFSAGVSATALALLRLPTSGFVAAGYSGTDFALAQYQKNGTLDASFGAGGKVTTSFAGGAVAFALARQADGKLVAAGTAADDFGLARYNPDGTLDSTFGTGGEVVTTVGQYPDQVSALLLQGDGKIVAAGLTFDSTGTDSDFALARYNPDGTLDSTFGTGGIVKTDFGGNDRGLDAVLQPDGKIVVVGESSGDVALARYNTDGSLDSTFGTGGKVTTDFGADLARATGVALDSAGNIVAAGTFFGTTKEFLIARYTPGGTLDPTFGTGGLAYASFGAGFTEGEALAIEGDGKLVVAGHHGATLQTEDFALARFRVR